MKLVSIASKLTAAALIATLTVPLTQLAQADVAKERPTSLLSTSITAPVEPAPVDVTPVSRPTAE